MIIIGHHANTLIDAIHEKDWAKVVEECSEHPALAKHWYKVKLTKEGTPHTVLALHYLLYMAEDSPEFLVAVRTLIATYPHALECKDSPLTRTPLHLACIKPSAPSDLISTLIRACPEAATEKDRFERLPLHYLAATNKVGAIARMLDAFPEGCTRRDGQGWLPLHVACHYKSTLETVQELLRANPDAVIAVTPADRETPLELVMKQEEPFEDKREIMDLLREKEEHYIPTPHPYIDSFVTDNFIHPIY